MTHKTVHFIWLGGNPLPERQRKCLARFLDLHPDWKVHLWTDEAVASLMKHPDLAPLHEPIQKHWDKLDASREDRRLAFRADLVRLLVVWLYGGVYLDIDLWFVRKFPDEFLEDELLLALINEAPMFVGEAVVGAPARSPKVLRLLNFLFSRQIDPTGAVATQFSRLVYDNKWKQHCKPPRVFIPHRRQQLSDEFLYRCYPDTVSVHLWREATYDFERLKALGETYERICVDIH